MGIVLDKSGHGQQDTHSAFKMDGLLEEKISRDHKIR